MPTGGQKVSKNVCSPCYSDCNCRAYTLKLLPARKVHKPAVSVVNDKPPSSIPAAGQFDSLWKHLACPGALLTALEVALTQPSAEVCLPLSVFESAKDLSVRLC